MTKLEVLTKLAKGLINEEEASEMLDLVEANKKPVEVKRTKDGKSKISIYGLRHGAYPTTLWDSQWERVLDGVAPQAANTTIGSIQALIASRKAEEEAAAFALLEKAEAEVATAAAA